MSITPLHSPANQPFIDFILGTKLLSRDAIERADRLAYESLERFGVVLLKLALLSEQELANAYSKHTNLPILRPSLLPKSAVAKELLTDRFLKKSLALPLQLNEREIKIALVDPTDHETVEAVRFATNRQVSCQIILASDFNKAFQRLYENDEHNASALVTRLDPLNTSTKDTERLRDLNSEAPIIQAVNHWIDNAVELGASDIHLEPRETAVDVRFRLDGQLQTIETLPSHAASAISSRIKIMARLDIAERRLPQDGKFRAPVRGRDIDFRVSVIPTVHGESIVLRVLDRGQIKLDFSLLGFDANSLQRFRKILHRPNGIMLVTGPTGSGKTTTLYTSLQEIRSPETKILTVEDPVEYQLDGINQTQVQPQIGLTFANALRSFLRHDPDIILLGEIRDTETARIAVQAALTGHLVLSTLHTNDAPSAIARLTDMGVDSYLIASTITGVAAQRLVRRLCEHCREPYELDQQTAQKLGLLISSGTLYRAKGCPDCRESGYRGRSVIVETLIMTEDLKSAVLRGAGADEIRRIAQTEGMQTMQLNGLEKCARGETSLDEIFRVTGVN